jgi:hypothetical protein
MARPQSILTAVMAAAIRERRVLSITYTGAIQPQLFAPVALYVDRANRLMVDGYEISGQRVRWRELDLTMARDLLQTEHTYTCDAMPPLVRKSYPRGTAMLERAKLD